jgi:membrane-associated phospholipid phosphatase
MSRASMFPFEGLVIAYLAFFALVAPFTRVERRRRTRTAIAAASAAFAVFIASRVLPIEARLWLPFLYIVLGYWIPVPLVPSDGEGAFERWLRRTDAAVRRGAAIPRWLASAAELGYLACFPIVPAAFAVAWRAGSPVDVVRFWMAILVAGLICYGTLPWLVSRPPRLIERDAADREPTRVTRANVAVLGRVSHHMNTFPSGHVAVSVAAAISVGRIWPAAGVVLGVIAAAVAFGAVVGRYHFVVDVMLGAGLGIVAGSA